MGHFFHLPTHKLRILAYCTVLWKYHTALFAHGKGHKCYTVLETERIKTVLFSQYSGISKSLVVNILFHLIV